MCFEFNLSTCTSHNSRTILYPLKDIARITLFRFCEGLYGIVPRRKVWLSVNNRVLYTDELYYIDFISDMLGLELHNITSLDICLDMSKNIPQYLRRLIKDKSLCVILNGKSIKDRQADRPEIIYIRSGNLNKEKYLTVNIKEKKAINDKSKGRTLTAYNKLAEIANSSGKNYINDKYKQPPKIYRLEVHLNNEEIKNYIERTRTELNINTIFNINFIYSLYIDTLNHIIRFEHEGKKSRGKISLTGL